MPLTDAKRAANNRWDAKNMCVLGCKVRREYAEQVKEEAKRRGADLLSSTARQLYLYRLLGLPAPKFAHCPLLLASDGRRLSKRDGDQSLENLRARYTAEEIVTRDYIASGGAAAD